MQRRVVNFTFLSRDCNINEMRIRAIVSDIDGTLLDTPKQTLPSERMLAAIRALKDLGIEFYLVSSRSFPNAQPLMKVLPSQNPAVLYGGAEIVQPDGTVLVQHSIAPSKVAEIIKITSKLDFSVLTDGSNGRKQYESGVTLDKIENSEGLKRIVVLLIPPKSVDMVVKQFDGMDDISCHVVPSGEVSGLFHVHLTDNQADKGKAVHELAKMIGVDPSELLAAGDGRNDVSLFEAVGYKVAMGNAADELKQIADRVIGDVADDGLAQYLEELTAEIANKVV